MHQPWKRFISLLMAVAVLLSLQVPTLAADENSPVLTEEDYTTADALFAAIEAKTGVDTYRNTAQDTTQVVLQVLEGSDAVAPDSIQVNGESVTWQTVQEIHCIYSTRLQNIADEAQPMTEDAGPDASATSCARRDAAQHGRDV